MHKEKSQWSLADSLLLFSLSGCVNSLETLQSKHVAQPGQGCESRSNKQQSAAERLLGPANGEQHPDTTHQLWPHSTCRSGWILAEHWRVSWDRVLGQSASLFKHCWGPWDSGAPLVGAKATTSLCVRGVAFASCPAIASGNYPGTISKEARLPSSCEPHWGLDGNTSITVLAFLTVSEESRWGSHHLQNLINAERHQGMSLLREAEQMC